MNYEKTISYIENKFKSVNSPQMLMNDSEFVKLFKSTYYNIFHVMPKIYTCGVCMFEHYKELTALNKIQIKKRLNMKNNIKEGRVIFASDGRPYSRKSVNITNNILKELEKKHPDAFEEIKQKDVNIPESKSEKNEPEKKIEFKTKSKK